MKEMLIKEIESRVGLAYDETVVTKNGIEKKALTVGYKGANVMANIYYEDIEGNAKDIIDSALKNMPKINIDTLMSKENMLDNVFIAIQKVSEENLVRKPSIFAGLELYLVMKVNENATVKIQPQVLDRIGVTEMELFAKAEENTYNNAIVMSLDDMIMSMITESTPKESRLNELDYTQDDIICVTNKDRVKGAGIIGVPKALEKIKEILKADKLIIIPSSIHEVLITPYTEGFMELSKSMIPEINEKEVRAEDKLSDTPYIF